MGCRGIILVKEKNESEGVSLFSHHGGSELASVLQNVLQRHARWDDSNYLARMIFSKMIPAEERQTETGYGIGIGNDYLDLDATPIEINIETQMVECAMVEWSFEEYTRLSDEAICNVDPMNNPAIRDR